MHALVHLVVDLETIESSDLFQPACQPQSLSMPLNCHSVITCSINRCGLIKIIKWVDFQMPKRKKKSIIYKPTPTRPSVKRTTAKTSPKRSQKIPKRRLKKKQEKTVEPVADPILHEDEDGSDDESCGSPVIPTKRKKLIILSDDEEMDLLIQQQGGSMNMEDETSSPPSINYTLITVDSTLEWIPISDAAASLLRETMTSSSKIRLKDMRGKMRKEAEVTMATLIDRVGEELKTTIAPAGNRFPDYINMKHFADNEKEKLTHLTSENELLQSLLAKPFEKLTKKEINTMKNKLKEWTGEESKNTERKGRTYKTSRNTNREQISPEY